MKFRLNVLAAVVACFVTASGCTSAGTIKNARETSKQDLGLAQSYLEEMRKTQPSANVDNVEIVQDGSYVSSRAIAVTSLDAVALDCHIAFSPSSPATLAEAASTITSVCGIPVNITQDATQYLAGGGSMQPMASSGPTTMVPPLSGAPNAPGFNNNAMSSSGYSTGPRYSASYSGKLRGFLDSVAGSMDLSWSHRNGTITFRYVDTRTFRLFSIPNSSTSEVTVHSGTTTSAGVSSGGDSAGGGGSGGVGGSAGSNQMTSITTKNDAKADLSDAIKSMLTPGIGRMSVSTSLGAISVTDTGRVLDAIGAFIDQQNVTLTQQVLLHVKLIRVTANNSDELGLNWDLAYTNVLKNYGLRLLSGQAASPGATSGSVNILEGSSRFAGSQAIISALAQQGTISMVSQPSVTALNLQAAPIQIAKQTSYLAGSTNSQTQSGNTTALQPGTITAGLNLVVLPYILPNNKDVLLQFSLNLSSLEALRRETSDGSAIELPDLNQTLVTNNVKLRSGQTLILNGFDQRETSATAKGTGNPFFWLLGGSKGQKSRRESLVILVTPVVLD